MVGEKAIDDGIEQLDDKLPEGLNRRQFFTTAVATVGSSLIAGCTGGQNATPTESNGGEGQIIRNVTFRGPWQVTSDYSPMFIARQNGFWADRDISPPSVKRGHGSGDTMQRLGAGGLEFGQASFSAMLNAYAQDYDFTVFGAGKQMSQLAFIWRKDKMDSPEDLANKQVILQTAQAQQTWPVYADLVNAPDSVETTFASEGAAPDLLASGDYDAVWSFVPDFLVFGNRIDAELGADPLYNRIKVYGYGLAVKSSWLEESEENVEFTTRLLEGFSAAGKWVLLNPEETIDIMRNEVNPNLQAVDKSTLRSDLKGALAALNLTTVTKDQGYGYLDRDAVQNTIDDMGPALGIEPLPSSPDEISDFTIQEDAELSTFSDDEWNQVREYAQPFTDLLGA